MSPEHDSNAPASANEMNANENAGENPANSAVAGPANNAGANSIHSEPPLSTSSSSGAAAAAVRAPEVVVEPPCETRAEVTEAEAHAAEAHPAVAEQTPTHVAVEPVVEGDPAFAGNARLQAPLRQKAKP